MSYIADDIDYLDLWDEFYKDINKKLRMIMEDSGRTNRMNAKTLGLKYQGLINLMNSACNSRIKTKTIKLLVDNFGVSLDWLFDVRHTLPKYTQGADHVAINSGDFDGILDWHDYYEVVNDKFRNVFEDACQSMKDFSDEIGKKYTKLNNIFFHRTKTNTTWTFKELKTLADDYAVSLDWLFDVGYKRKRYRR